MSRSWSARLDVTRTQAGHIGQISSGTIKSSNSSCSRVTNRHTFLPTYQEACDDTLDVQHAARTHKSLVAQLVTVSECKLLEQGAVVVQLAWQFDMQSIQGSTPCP